MKKLLFTLLAFLSISVAVNKVSAQSGAKIEFAKETHDYGKIKNGADPYCSFEFKNTGDAPLIISDAKGSCGCTVPEWPKEPIAPGAKASIKVRYDTKREGVISKNVTIMSNAVNTPEKVIYITGEVIGAPAPDPVEPAKN
jgi:hypothetical protein